MNLGQYYIPHSPELHDLPTQACVLLMHLKQGWEFWEMLHPDLKLFLGAGPATQVPKV